MAYKKYIKTQEYKKFQSLIHTTSELMKLIVSIEYHNTYKDTKDTLLSKLINKTYESNISKFDNTPIYEDMKRMYNDYTVDIEYLNILKRICNSYYNNSTHLYKSEVIHKEIDMLKRKRKFVNIRNYCKLIYEKELILYSELELID